MMNRYFVLHIEDNPGDAFIVNEMLTNNSVYTITNTHAESLTDALAHLVSAKFNVVLLDLGLPDTVDTSGVEKIRSLYPEICLIVLTGNENANLGPKLIKLGAQDYLNKNKLDQDSLIKSIRFSIERQKYQQKIRQQEEALREFKTAVEQGENTIVVTDLSGIIEYVNPKFTKTSGYTAREAIGQPISILKSGHHDEAFYKDLWQTIKNGEAWSGEIINKQKSGAYYWESTTITPIRNNDGVIHKYITIKEEITERKKSQDIIARNERHMRFLANASSDLLKLKSFDELFTYIAAHAFKFVDENGSVFVCQLTGSTFELVASKSSSAPILNIKQKFTQWLSNINTKKDKIINVLSKNALVDISSYIEQSEHDAILQLSAEKHVYAIGFCHEDHLLGKIIFLQDNQNIEQNKKTIEGFADLISLFAEKQFVLEKLINNERRFMQVAATAEDWIWEIDSNGVFTYSNPSVFKIVGYKPEELIGKLKFTDLLLNTNQSSISSFINRDSPHSISYKNQIEILKHKNGSGIWIHSSGTTIKDNSHKVTGYRGTNSDITPIIKSREHFKKIIQFAPSAIFIISKDGKIVMTNFVASKILKLDQENILDSYISSFDPNFNLKINSKDVDKALASKENFTYESVLIGGDKNLVPVESSLTKINFENEDHFILFARDISERKAAELQIKRNAAILRDGQKTANLASWTWDTKSNTISWSDNFRYIIELNEEALPQTPNEFIDYIHPEYFKQQNSNNQEILNILKSTELNEFILLTKSGKQKHVYTKATTYFESKDLIFGIIQDVTEFKENEIKLAEAQHIAKLGSWEYDVEKDEYALSPEARNILGNNIKGTFNIERFYQVLHPEDVEFFSKEVARVFEGEKVDIDFRIIINGKTKWVSTKSRPIINSNNVVTRTKGIVQDITKQKEIQFQILENEQQLEEAQKIGNMGYWKYLPSTKQFQISKEAYNILEINSHNKSISKNHFIENLSLSDQVKLTKDFTEKILKGQIYNNEFRLKNPKGKDKWIFIKTSDNTNAKLANNVTGIIQDITERKEAELVIARNEKHLSKVFDIALMGRFRYDVKKDQIEWSHKALEILALSENQSVDTLSSYSEIVSFPMKKRVARMFLNASNRANQVEQNHRIVINKQKEKWVRIITEYEYDEETGELLWTNGIIKDIDEERTRENELLEKNYQLDNLVRSVPGIVFSSNFDKNYTMNFISQKCYEITGYTSDEFINNTPSYAQIISPRDQNRVWQTLMKTYQEGKEYEIRYRIKHKSGKELWLWESGAFRSNEQNGEITTFIEGIITDITDIVNTEEKILMATLQGEDDERRRIAGDIHDGVQQTLTSALYALETVNGEINNLSPGKAANYKKGLTALRNGLEETRDIAHNIMPKSIQDFGLVKSIETLSQNPKGIEINFYENLSDYRLDSIIETSLYRICQEALNNIYKYAEATEITIQIMKHDDCIIMTIEDNGKGFDMKEIPLDNESGLGISSMKSRASAISGTFDLSSRPGHGSCIVVEIPIKFY